MIAEGKTDYESKLSSWIELEKAAVELIHEIGRLWFDTDKFGFHSNVRDHSFINLDKGYCSGLRE